MRFGASCCPTWDPSNWFSRKLPSLMSFWMLNKSRQNENQKLLRTASEEEIFKKRPKRKVKKRRKSADDQPSSICSTNTNTAETTSRRDQDSNTESSVSENCSSVKPRKRRSRREQQALAAKSSRGGKSGYTAANLRRYAAERKPSTPKQALELGNRSQSTSALGIKRMTAASANQMEEKGTNQ
eukprot:08792.XXX_506149_506700_1 [CDS] Oithona nana genome sequencing.